MSKRTSVEFEVTVSVTLDLDRESDDTDLVLASELSDLVREALLAARHKGYLTPRFTLDPRKGDESYVITDITTEVEA